MSRASEVRTGLFVVVALAILGLGTLWILGAKPWSGARTPYEVLMQRAGGVRNGDQVRLAGVEVGRVEEVRLAVGEEWPVTFTIQLDEAVVLSTESSARFASDGLLGSSFLEIVAGPPTADRLPPGGRIYGKAGGGLSDMLAGMDGMTDKVDRLLDDAGELVRTVSTRLDSTLDRVDQLLSDDNLVAFRGSLQSMQRLLGDVETRLPSLLARVEAVTAKADGSLEEVPSLVQEVDQLVSDLRTALGQDGERLGGVLDQAQSALGSADGAFTALEDREADLEATMRNLREASAHLKAFAQSIRSQPSRVLRTPKTPDRKPGEGVQR
ncbi:MAG: MlaD family protein [Acidobacteriota bacterium]